MGGVRIDTLCHTDLDGLYAAGEDAGGVHGANRLGGNGIADSTVYGGIAGDSMANDVIGRELFPYDENQVEEIIRTVETPSEKRERTFTLCVRRCGSATGKRSGFSVKKKGCRRA